MKILNGKPHYDSFGEALREIYGKKQKKHQLKDSTKDKFKTKNTCRVCKEPMEWITGTSVMICKNPKCKGVPHEKKSIDGTSSTYYSPSYRLLDSVGCSLAEKIFD